MNATPQFGPVGNILFERSADGVLIADPSGAITHINPAAIAMLGVSAMRAEGKKPSVLFRHNSMLLDAFQREGEQVLEVPLPRRRTALAIACTLEDGHRLVLLQDVTEQRRIDAGREELVTRMAHDLRNPLMAMSGFAELIETLGGLSAQQAHFAMRLRQTATKLYDVAAELVDLAWIEAGLPMQHRPVVLQDPIMRAVDALTKLAEDRHCGIAFSVQDPLPRVMGDPDRLYMLVFQLLENALLYSELDSSIAIHAWSDGADVYVSVADKGIGISDHEIHLVFDRLYRSNDARVQAIPGGGLGLTLARKIVYRHGGDIWVAANLGDGSTFTFVLPGIGSA